jgi:acetamidase/formamidase
MVSSYPMSRFPAQSAWRLRSQVLTLLCPPSRWGGNMDTKHLRIGTTLYLPVGVEEALFSVGDTHSAQGDGEVCGTAIETAMDVSLRLSVRRDFRIEAPQYRVPPGAPRGRGHWLPRFDGCGTRFDGGDQRCSTDDNGASGR